MLTGSDQIYARLKHRNGGVGRPEFRIPLLIPGALLVFIGFFWYGWSIQSRLHWIMPNTGALIFGSGIIISMQCTTSYIVDAYSIYAASAVAATTVLRALAGFGKQSDIHCSLKFTTLTSIQHFPCLRLICIVLLVMAGQIPFWHSRRSDWAGRGSFGYMERAGGIGHSTRHI